MKRKLRGDDRHCQRGRKFRVRQKEEEVCESLSYCRHAVYQRRQQQISRAAHESFLSQSWCCMTEKNPILQQKESGFKAYRSDRN